MHDPVVRAFQPVSNSQRRFVPDERCRFRPISDGGLRVVIRLTCRCDLACPYCLVGGHYPGRELEFSAWKRILAGLPAVNARKVLLTGGEPLLHHDLADLVALISGMGIAVDLNSNLQQMTRARMEALRAAGLTEISTAIEGPPALHDRARGMAGAFARTAEAITWATGLGIQVDASCCLSSANLPCLDELLEQMQAWPLQSFTVSRIFPIGHGARRHGHSISQEELSKAYFRLAGYWMPRSRMPLRVVGLLGHPRPDDCQRGVSLIGVAPDGRLLACVLMGDQPDGLPHPLDAGLAASVAALRERLGRTQYPLCWEETG
jgi:MoaA/NifB/PqqE/SkfB family radical SAM enzyme